MLYGEKYFVILKKGKTPASKLQFNTSRRNLNTNLHKTGYKLFIKKKWKQ